MKIVQGDICDASERMILQGCNAQGVMGSGVAKAIRAKWSKVYDEYVLRHKQGLFYGNVVFVQVEENKCVACIITQDKYGYDGQKYARYSALVKGLEEVRHACWSL